MNTQQRILSTGALVATLFACSQENTLETNSRAQNTVTAEDRVGVVIRFADVGGKVIAASRCLRLNTGETQITGQMLLSRVLPAVTQYTFDYPFGVALCGLETKAMGTLRKDGCYPSATTASTSKPQAFDAGKVHFAAAQGLTVRPDNGMGTTSPPSPSAVNDACFCNATKSWAYFLKNTNASWASAMESYATRVLTPGQLDGWSWSGFDANFNATDVPPETSFETVCKSGAGSDAFWRAVYLPTVSK